MKINLRTQAETTDSADTTDAAVLLTQVDERLQSTTINNNLLILSSYDALAFGGSTDLTLNYKSTNDNNNSGGTTGTNTDQGNNNNDTVVVDEVFIFGEGLVFTGDFQANSAVISASSLVNPAGQIVLDVSGADMTSSKGQSGGAGGSLSLYLEYIDPSMPPKIIARGGAGGPGASGTWNHPAGGNGGSGGAGGNVIVLISHPGLHWIEMLRAAYALTDPESKVAALEGLLEQIPASMTNLRAGLQEALQGTPSINTLNNAIEGAFTLIQINVEDWQAMLMSFIDISGGVPGTYGEGTPNGSSGAAGILGQSFVKLIGSIDQAQPVWQPFFSVHPSQCAMTLEKAKLAYLFLDPKKNPQGVADAAMLFDRVRQRTAPFLNLDEQSDLAKYYTANESKFGCINALDRLRSTNAEATMYLSYIKTGNDFFGYPEEYVPLTSLKAITDNGVTPILTAFQVIEQAYNTYFKRLKKNKKNMDYVSATREQILSLSAQVNVNLPQLLASLTATASNIDAYQAVLPDKKNKVDAALQQYANAIKDCDGFTWQTFLTALGQVGSASDSTIMYLAQAAQVTYTAMTTVTDIQGQPIRKDFLVQQIQSVDADVKSIVEGCEVQNDGTIVMNDPGGNKLVADSDKIESLLDQLYGQIPIEAEIVKEAIQDYVNTVFALNNQVLAYNAAVSKIVGYTQMQQQMAQQAESLNDEVLTALTTNIPELTAFMSQSYYKARAQVLEFMDLASRAYRFWALEEGNLLRDSLGDVAPPNIDSAVLSSIQTTFWAQYTKSIGNVGSSQSFPMDPNAPRGETYTVTGEAIDTFRTTGHLMVRIPPAMKETSEGPFLNMANVRVTHVRAYIKGAKTTSGMINLTITHTGSEQIISPDNKLFRFEHASISKTFKYAIATEQIELDATFQFTDSNDDKNLALVGPYTFWRITVDPNHNEGLDLLQVTEVELDFRGISWGYN